MIPKPASLTLSKDPTNHRSLTRSSKVWRVRTREKHFCFLVEKVKCSCSPVMCLPLDYAAANKRGELLGSKYTAATTNTTSHFLKTLMHERNW